MKIPRALFEEVSVVSFLKTRGLVDAYKRRKTHLLSGHNTGALLKPRQPKKLGLWYFRINRQYRAICRWEGDNLIVFMIDDHQ